MYLLWVPIFLTRDDGRTASQREGGIHIGYPGNMPSPKRFQRYSPFSDYLKFLNTSLLKTQHSLNQTDSKIQLLCRFMEDVG